VTGIYKIILIAQRTSSVFQSVNASLTFSIFRATCNVAPEK
jgi:hypothetical protein